MLGEIDITVGEIIIYILAGLVIGFLARLIVPGRQDMSIVGTVLVGVIAAVVGGLLWELIFPDNDGIAWIGSIIVAVVLVWLYSRIAPRMAAGQTATSARSIRGTGDRGNRAA